MNASDSSSPIASHPPRTRKRMAVMLGLCALVFGTVFGLKAFSNKMMGQYFDNQPVPPATITSATVDVMRWKNEVEAPGSLVAVNGTDVTTEAGGLVQAIHFESGQSVAAGDLLVTLDGANEQAELKRLAALAELARVNRVRREKMFKLAAVARSDYDAAVAESNAAQAAVDAQRAKVAQKEIRAAFAGALGIRRINVGQYLAPGTSIVSLQALEPIDADFALPEQLLSQARAGLAVELTLDAWPGQAFAGQVLAVEPRVDPSTRNFLLRARLPNTDHKLRGGMFARVRLALPGDTEVLAVPRTAINYDPFGSSVFVIEKKAPAAGAKPAEPPPTGSPPASDLVVQQRFVKTGIAKGDFVAVMEGLKRGDLVATSGLLKLRNGQPVVIDNSVRPDVKLDPKPEET